MRISDDRYSRDRQRLDVAMHFIRHEARTRTIRQFTGLTDDRIRKLYRSYRGAGAACPARHRGRSPQQAGYFLRTARLREHSATLASVCGMVGLLGQGGAQGTGIASGLLLCQAYEAYRRCAAEPAISFEHAILLVGRLQRGTDLRLGHCRTCGAVRVVEGFGLRAPRCLLCEAAGAARA